MGSLLVLLILAALYFIPAIVAAMRGHRQALPIFFLNALLGWTVIGWVGALVWALIAGAEAAPQPAPVTNLRACPHCAEAIQPAARICRYCGRDV